MPKQFILCPNPCPTCPYRRDVPSGVWAEQEYVRLKEFDDQRKISAFLCHNGGSDPKTNRTLCRGWVEVHNQNWGVRLALCQVEWNDANSKPTKVPLYKSGAQAMKAGLRKLNQPSREARAICDKLARKGKVWG